MGTPVTSGNRGVLALCAASTKLLLETYPDAEVVLLGSHPRAGTVTMRPLGADLPLRIVHWRLSPRAAWRDQLPVIVLASFLYRFVPARGWRSFLARRIPWIAELETTDFVGDIRGGDSFSDIYGLKRFIVATLPVLSVIWVKGGIVQLPQTFGPFRSGLARWIARRVLRSSTTVIARDTESQKVAEALLGSQQPVHLSPDVAFGLHVDAPALVQLDGPAPEPLPADAVGINVNGLMYNGGYTGKNMFGLKLDYRAFLPALIERLLAVHPGPLLLVPHTYAPAGDVESDNEASRLVKAALPAHLQSRVRIVTGDYDCHQLKGIIGRCQFFVGSRMHSCIAALSQGVPCVGVAYSMKFRGVFATAAAADWIIDGRTAEVRDAVAAVVACYASRSVKGTAIRGAAADAQRRLRESVVALLRSIRTRPAD